MIKSKRGNLSGLFLAIPISVLLAFGADAKSKGTPMPTDTPRAYLAVSNSTPATLGETMNLSRTTARFTKLKGEMKLRYSGVWNVGENTQYGGQVYQVLNADEFFSKNKGKNGFCDEPVRWLTVLDKSKQLLEGTILVAMFNIQDWHKYTENSTGLCSIDSFQLK